MRLKPRIKVYIVYISEMSIHDSDKTSSDPPNVIDYHEFMKSKKILHSEIVNEKNDIQFLIDNEKEYDGISYDNVERFLIFNTAVLSRDGDCNYYYEYTLERNSEIVDNISVVSLANKRFKLSYNIGTVKHEFENITELILIAMQYHPPKLRITFLEKPSLDDEFEIRTRRYLLSEEPRKQLARSPIRTNYLKYMHGMCGVPQGN